MSIRVLQTGWESRLVDGGRPHTRRHGVPVGGAADGVAFALGNALVGNPPEAPALEIAVRGPVLEALDDVAAVLLGAPFALEGDFGALRTGWTFNWPKGGKLTVGGTPRGLRGYLCVLGGFTPPRILGSCSALASLRPDEVLPCGTGRIRPRSLCFPEGFYLPPSPIPLQVVPGLQADWFDYEDFADREFTVSPDLNRMGIRLDGPPLTVPDRELVSEPIAPGAIQVTRAGQCIIVGMDGQTIGGYPKIAHVVQADLHRLGQLRPGATLRFRRIDLAEARRLWLEQTAFLEEYGYRLRTTLDTF